MFMRRRGSLTVEAVLILPIFMAAILFISYFIKAYYVQDVVQDALTEAVMEVSSLSYPYYLSGALEFKGDIHEETAERIGILKDNFKAVSGLIERVKGTEDSSGLFQSGIEGITPKTMFQLVKLYAAEKGIKAAQDTIARSLILGTIGNVLSLDGKSVVDRMNALGIEKGLEGFNFTDSVFYGDGDVIDIQVKYRLIKVDPFGLINGVTLKNRVVCQAWMGGVDINNDGSYKRVTVPPNITVSEEDPEQENDREFRTYYIIQDSQISGKYHLHDCPNLRVRGDPSKRKTVIAIQVSFIKKDGIWKPEGCVDYQGRTYDFCGSCQAGIIRMKD